MGSLIGEDALGTGRNNIPSPASRNSFLSFSILRSRQTFQVDEDVITGFLLDASLASEVTLETATPLPPLSLSVCVGR